MAPIWDATPARKAAVIIAHALCWILGIISALGIWRFWKARARPYVAKRHPKLVIICCLSLWLSLCFDLPLVSYARLTWTTSLLLRDVRYITQILSTLIICLCVLFRVYICCVDVSFATAMSRHVWAKHISKTGDAESIAKDSCFVRHHKRLSDVRHIYPLFIVFGVLLIVGTLILEFTVGTSASWTLYVISTISLVLITVLFWVLTPKFIDHFRVSAEIARVVWTEISVTTLFVLYTIFFHIIDSESFVLFILIQIAAAILMWAMCFFQTDWILMQNTDIEIHIMEEEPSVSTAVGRRWSLTGGSSPRSTTNDAEAGGPSSRVLHLEIFEVIAESVGFDAFMNHLALELSMENLLGVIEFTQFKQRFREIETVHRGGDPFVTQKSLREKVKGLATNMVDSTVTATVTLKDKGKELGSKVADSTKQTVKKVKDIPNVLKKDRGSFSGKQADVAAMGSPSTPASRSDTENPTSHSDTEKSHEGTEPHHGLSLDDIETVDIVDDEGNHETVEIVDLQNGLALKRQVTARSLNVRTELVALPDCLPKSHIVYGEIYDASDGQKIVEEIQALDLKEWAEGVIRELFAKYIEVGSELELNLSHKLRKKSLNRLTTLSEMDVHKMEHIFDGCISGVCKLMQDSYSRFKESPEYQTYIEEVAREKESAHSPKMNPIKRIMI